MKLRTKFLLAAFGIASVSVLVVTVIVSWSLQEQLLERIENELISEIRLVGEVVSRLPENSTAAEFDAEADALGEGLGVRVTLIASDGRVVGDSAADGLSLVSMDNHGARPEIEAARRSGLGLARRLSITVERELLYAAVPVDHPELGFARVALSLTAIDQQVISIWRGMAVGLLLALGGALTLAWVTAEAMSRRVSSLAVVAKKYADGDLSPKLNNYGNDEIGAVARAFDESVHELARRIGELSRNRRLTKAIMSSMSEGVLVVDVNGQVQMANVAACEMLQIVKSPLRRHYLELIRHPKLIKQITGALEEEGSSRSETVLNTDPPRICFVSVTHFVSQDEPGIVLVLHDVTNYRRSMQIRQDFVANVSHELRTPLTAIRGSVDTLLDQDNVADERRFLEIIARHTARMESLVRDLLRLARLDAGQEALDLIPCSIASLFAEVQTELDPLITSKTQRIDIRITPNPLIITADHAKLHDVIKNLIENAAQYSERDTTIEVTATTDDNEGVIVVGDRGPGIPDRDLVRVFERFYRVEQSRTREPGGTGLGLAIVKHLVGLHGGSVQAANRSGGGSLFTVRLPKARSIVADSDGFSDVSVTGFLAV